MSPRVDCCPHVFATLAFVFGIGCAQPASDTAAPERAPACDECTTVGGRVLSLDGEPLSSANLFPVPRAAAPVFGPDALVRVDADGRFSLTLRGFGARILMFGADGYTTVGTNLYADGSEVQLEVRLAAKDDAGGESSVAYLGAMNDTKRLGELGDGALCHTGLRECPPHAQMRAMIEEELARATTSSVRIPLWMAYLSARESLVERHENDEAYARQLLSKLEPTSWRWVEDSGALVVATRVAGDREYFMQAFRHHPDPDMPLLLLRIARRVAQEAGEQDEVERLAQFADDPRVKASQLNRVFNHQETLASRGLQPDSELPDFAATTIAGERIDDEQLPGKLTLIHFWGTWCSACKTELPLFHELIASFGEAGFAIVSFAQDESLEDVEQFRAERWPMPWDHVVMTPGQARTELERAFDVAAFPTWYLVDESNRVVLTSRHPAGSSAEARRDALREYLERNLPTQSDAAQGSNAASEP